MTGVQTCALPIVADTSGSLFLVDAQAQGLERIELTTIDLTRPVSELRFEGVAAERLPDSSPEVIQQMIDAGRTMIAADTLGAGQMMLEKAVEYAKERKQFNRVIGSFQAVKHLCAEMAAELEPCRSLVWYASYAQDALPDEGSLMACHAKAHLSEIGRESWRAVNMMYGWTVT